MHGSAINPDTPDLFPYQVPRSSGKDSPGDFASGDRKRFMENPRGRGDVKETSVSADS
jgi:hypothetical protein